MTACVIAIAGPSGSGKTELAKTVCQQLNEGGRIATVLHEDSYYRDQSHIPEQERAETNYDHPSAFDYALLLRHIQALKTGQKVDAPIYDYVSHNRADQTVCIEPRPVIIIEGILLLANPELLPEFQLKVFMDTPLDVCLLRRVKRDLLFRGRDIESVFSQYVDSVRPMWERFVEPSRIHADLIVPRGGKNRAAADMIKAGLKEISG